MYMCSSKNPQYPNIPQKSMAEQFCAQKLVDGKGQVQSPVTPVDLAVRSFL